MSLSQNETALLVASIPAIAGLAKPIISSAIDAYKKKVSGFDFATS